MLRFVAAPERAVQALYIFTERNLWIKADPMAVTVAGEAISLRAVAVTYGPYFILNTASTYC